MERKEKALKKYLEKKRGQVEREDLFKQICELSKNKKDSKAANNPPKKKIKKKLRNKRTSVENTENQETDSMGAVDVIKTAIDDPKTTIDDTKTAIYDINNVVDDTISVVDNTISVVDNTISVVDNTISVVDGTISVVEAKERNKSQIFVKIENISRTAEIEENRKKLDIYYEKTKIIEKIRENLITMIQGNTGCGKTTQIPQFLIEDGFTQILQSDGSIKHKLIGVTQPRRLSATSIAARINTELNERWCGYKIKYESTVTSATKIKVMTEGILLREIYEDFLLSRYSVIVLDEVHERSVNIDLLVGLLSRVVRIRHERGDPLRLCLMSATVDPEPFRRVLGEFSMVSLDTKGHKVDILSELEMPADYRKTIFDKVMMLLKSAGTGDEIADKKADDATHNKSTERIDRNGDILVFLPTKQDIYQLREMLAVACNESSETGPVCILPLHAGLSKSDQDLIHRKCTERKVILSTNIAETSITIDRLSFVIDSGLAKTRVKSEQCTKYAIESISKSSAKQRAGRLGRTGPGICFRIYTGELYEAFSDESIPQIYTEPLDSAVLQLRCLGIKRITKFPFVSPVSEASVLDAEMVLKNLRALDSCGAVTLLGSRMSRYPLSPSLSRLLLVKTNINISQELSVIAAMISVGFELRKTENTREYFSNACSDFIVWLRVYSDYLRSRDRSKFCRKVGMGFGCFVEVEKLSGYLRKLSESFVSEECYKINEEGEDALAKEEEIRAVLYKVFGAQTARRSGNTYFYSGGELGVSKNSIEADGDFVFENIICGRKEEYATGITLARRSKNSE